jgi:hypothetical protein
MLIPSIPVLLSYRNSLLLSSLIESIHINSHPQVIIVSLYLSLVFSPWCPSTGYETLLVSLLHTLDFLLLIKVP